MPAVALDPPAAAVAVLAGAAGDADQFAVAAQLEGAGIAVDGVVEQHYPGHRLPPRATSQGHRQSPVAGNSVSVRVDHDAPPLNKKHTTTLTTLSSHSRL